MDRKEMEMVMDGREMEMVMDGRGREMEMLKVDGNEKLGGPKRRQQLSFSPAVGFLSGIFSPDRDDF